jgi:hypothetical protein
MRRLAVLLLSGLSLLSWLPASATAGGPMGIGPQMTHAPGFQAGTPRRGVWPVPLVRADPYVVIVPVPVATPVPEVAAPPPPPAAPPPPPPERVTRRPVVVNPGPKILEVAPPSPGARTVDIVVVRGSTVSVEKVPVK